MKSKKQFSSSEIAKYFIWKSKEDNQPITNKKLQKLVYYAYAWFLVANKGTKKLFSEEIQAWVHGPVIPNLYHDYKKFGFGPIDTKIGSKNDFPDEVGTLLDEVWETYGHLDADTLEALTHSEKPWREARASTEVNEFNDAIIKDDVVLNYYSELKAKLEAANKDIPILNVG